MTSGVYKRYPPTGYPYVGKKPRTLTMKERNFANEYMKSGVGTEAALKTLALGSRGGAIEKRRANARVQATKMLSKPQVIEYINSFAQDAVTRIERMSRTARNESVRLLANKDILDRAGYKPAENTNLNLIVPRPLLSSVKEPEQLESGELTSITDASNNGN